MAETGGSPEPFTLLAGAHWDNPPQNTLDDSDADSALGEQQLSTASISSSIFKYRTIHGRTYHSENGNAQAANDEKHNEAADINHHVQTLVLKGKLFLAPIENPQLVVDIGTGTGIWAVDFADAFPSAHVIGTDISPNQPNWVPPNVEFQIDDCTQDWTFASDSIDYIHMRFLSGSITDWHALFREAYRCLKPGGYIETMEPWPYIQTDDDSIEPGSALSQWGPLFIEAGVKMGRPFTIAADGTQRAAMQAAGFEDLQDHRYKCPLGAWPDDPEMRELGMYSYAVLDQDMEGILLFIANKIHGWSNEQIQVFSSHMRREMRSGKHHAWYWQSVLWSRKPA